MRLTQLLSACFLGFASVARTKSCQDVSVINDGTPAGKFVNVSGIQIYQTFAPKNTSEYILHVTDIYGVPLLQNKLLADSIAKAGYNVIVPDLFYGDAIPVNTSEPGLNMTEWRARHPINETEHVLTTTINYIRNTLNATKLGAVGYCFGGKFVVRYLAPGRGIDAGFVAHPSNLETAEIQATAYPLTMAAGELDTAFNATLRHSAESILQSKNATYQLNLYSGAPHGFAVRPDLTVPRQKYAKESAFFQAVRWFDAWL